MNEEEKEIERRINIEKAKKKAEDKSKIIGLSVGLAVVVFFVIVFLYNLPRSIILNDTKNLIFDSVALPLVLSATIYLIIKLIKIHKSKNDIDVEAIRKIVKKEIKTEKENQVKLKLELQEKQKLLKEQEISVKKFIKDNAVIIDEIMPSLQTYLNVFDKHTINVCNYIGQAFSIAQSMSNISDFHEYYNTEAFKVNANIHTAFLPNYVSNILNVSFDNEDFPDLLLLSYLDSADSLKEQFSGYYNPEEDLYRVYLHKVIDFYTKSALVKFCFFVNVLERVISHDNMGTIIGNALNKYNSEDEVSTKTYNIYKECADDISGQLSEIEYEFVVRFYNIKYSPEPFKNTVKEYNQKVEFDYSSFENFIASIINNIDKTKCNYLALLKTFLFEHIEEYTIRDFFDKLFSLKTYLMKIQTAKEKYILITNQDEDEDNSLTIEDIDIMNGFEFEDFVALLFKKLGYKTIVTKSSGDQGIDVIAEKKDIKIAIQAKCYSNAVGNHAIMEAVAGKKFYGADRVMVVTNNHFTKSAIALAKSNNVSLWDRIELIKKINEIF